MNYFIILFFIYALVNPSVQINPQNNNIYDPGPSTSREADYTLSDEERCEIDLYAVDTASLFIGQDTSGATLGYLVEEQFEGLLASTTYPKTIVQKLLHGFDESPDSPTLRLVSNYRQRMRYFLWRLSQKLAEMTVDGCTDSYEQTLEFFYDVIKDTFTYYEQIIVKTSQCLNRVNALNTAVCRNVRQTEINNPSSSSRAVQRRVANNPENLPTYRYNVIAPALLEKFYSVWISNVIDSGFFLRPQCQISRRLNLWLQKILEVDLSNANPRSDMFSHSNRWQIVRENIMRSLLAWQPSGNTFDGPMPRRRGFFYPHFHVRGEESMYSFETLAEPIFTPDHYQDLVALYNRLRNYLKRDPLQSTHFERALDGFELLVTIGIVLGARENIPFDIDDWELRTVIERDLRDPRFTEQHKRKYLGKEFYVFKKKKDDHHREERSVTGEPDKCFKFEGVVRQRWSEFVHNLINNHLRTRYNNKTNLWTEDFLELYTQYKVISAEVKVDECALANFDSFLYFKFSNTPEYFNCLSFKATEPSAWCYALRNITLNSDLSDKWRKIIPGEQYYEQVITLLRWLVQLTTVAENSISNHDSTLKSPSAPEICNSSPGLSLVSCLNHCGPKIISARSRRSVTDVVYIKGVPGIKYNCECLPFGTIADNSNPSNHSSTTSSPTGSTTCSGHHCFEDDLR